MTRGRKPKSEMQMATLNSDKPEDNITIQELQQQIIELQNIHFKQFTIMSNIQAKFGICTSKII